MALINCPSCEKEIPAESASCPACGLLIAGGVFDFGIWRLLSLESSGNFWLRSDDLNRYEQQEELTKQAWESVFRINKTKRQIARIWLLGLCGSLAFHYFAVGRILSGSMRLLWGAFWWFMIVDGFPYRTSNLGILYFPLTLLFILPIIDIIIISLGWFRDVFGKRIT